MAARAPRHDQVRPRIGQEQAHGCLALAHRLLQVARVDPQRRLRLPEPQRRRKDLAVAAGVGRQLEAESEALGRRPAARQPGQQAPETAQQQLVQEHQPRGVRVVEAQALRPTSGPACTSCSSCTVTSFCNSPKVRAARRMAATRGSSAAADRTISA